MKINISLAFGIENGNIKGKKKTIRKCFKIVANALGIKKNT